MLAAGHRADRPLELGDRRVLQQVSGRAVAQRAPQVILVDVHGEHGLGDDLDPGESGQQRTKARPHEGVIVGPPEVDGTGGAQDTTEDPTTWTLLPRILRTLVVIAPSC